MRWFTEQDKHFLLTLSYLTGVILLWRGIWEGIGQLPLMENPWVSLFIGLLILTLTGWIYTEFDFFSQRAKQMLNVLTHALHDTKRGVEHTISYFDELTGKHQVVHAKDVRKVEQHHIIVEHEGRERFIPLQRISEIKRGKKSVWRKT